MKPLIGLKSAAPRLLIILALLFFGLFPGAQAVVPPPDGGYPNFTTAEGTKALFSLTTGAANTAVGWFSLKSVTTGSFNTGVGAGTLVLNGGDENTGVGTAALLLNTASGNTAVGSRALLNNTTGGTPGTIQGLDFGPNVAVGQQALESNTVASANTAMGYQALQNFIMGPLGGGEQLGLCTAVGFQALANATGEANANSGFGYQALKNNTEGPNNTAIGFRALTGNTTGGGNIAVGSYTLEAHTEGDANTAIGFRALGTNVTGVGNTAVGASAGSDLTTGDNNIDIGNTGVAGDSDTIRIGSEFQTRIFFSAIRGVTTGIPDAVNVVIDSNGQLGTMSSSHRFKKEIRAMDTASEAILALKPVTFHYKSDTKDTPQFGLIAEEVAEVNPNLVVRDKNGEIYTVRYDAVNAMLLNEFLKEHRKVEQMQQQIEALTMGLQKVSAQLELTKSASQTIVDN